MPYRLEITLKQDLFDAEGAGICRKAEDYFGIKLERVRTVNVLTIDADLTTEQLEKIRTEIFTNPVTQISSFAPIPVVFDWIIWVGYKPGVRDNPGSTAIEAIEDVLKIKFSPDEAIYTSKRYCLKSSGLTTEDVNTIAGELLANDIIQQWKIFSKEDWKSTPLSSAKSIAFGASGCSSRRYFACSSCHAADDAHASSNRNMMKVYLIAV